MSANGVGVVPQSRIRPAVLDRFEQVLVLLLYSVLTYRVFHSDNPFRYLLLASESAVVIFVLIRRPTEALSIVFGEWMLAFTATAATLLVAPVPNQLPALVPLGVTLFALGALFQISAKIALNRSFGIAPANRGIKRSGPYRYVRHPMYAGYFINNVGLLMLMLSFTNAAVYAIAWTAQVMRVLAEERLLSQDSNYRAYMKDVRWRVVPGVF
ncbi:isoprenylcysteine carboxylmethyltransferase family protein [Novosphingobium sp.]|uniref:methyltransferase family protein n=1 Tax=Novosphingobium sp. TaxID=1874826 RepID=UPI0025FD41BB|nr:isoprenylcysteine carboxylmethyltransferase family protein [Novosphingobium sp.]